MPKSSLTLVGILLISWTTSGCVPIVATAAATGGYMIGRDERTIEQISEDAALTARVKTALVRDERVRALDINVDTYLSVVTLKGEVADAAEQRAAESIARAVAGVKEVRVELKLRPVVVEERS